MTRVSIPPARKSWKIRLGSLVEILLAAGLVTDWFALSALSFFPALASPVRSVSNLAIYTTFSSTLLLILLVWLRRLRGRRLLPLLVGDRRNLGKEVLQGILLVPVLFVLVFLLKSGIHHWVPEIYSGSANVLEELMRTPRDMVLFVFVGLFSGGIKEEVQRGFIIRSFERGWGPRWLAALLFAVFFGWRHRFYGVDEAIIAGLLGLGWGLIYARRLSVITPVVSHGLYDGIELVRYYLWGPFPSW